MEDDILIYYLATKYTCVSVGDKYIANGAAGHGFGSLAG